MIGLGMVFKGGRGSGFHGHGGRDGKVGGSSPRKGRMVAAKSREKLPEHIQHLRIPPAWKELKYNESPEADLLVTGKDAKGRTQYVYSERFKTEQAEAKFERIKELDKKFPEISKQNDKHLSGPNAEEAACLKLIMSTGIRPGSDKDTRADKKAYGATTLEGKHVKQTKDGVRLEFIGKKGVALSIPVRDAAMQKMVLQRAKKAGANGKLFGTNEGDLLNYTHTLDGGSFKTKDFRTRIANNEAQNAMKGMPVPKTMKEYKKAVKQVATYVSGLLGNTATVALQSYINPAVFSAWRANI